MATRKRTRVDLEPVGPYIVSPDDKNLAFFSCGCALLDAVLGGGYVLGRIANLVGDKSSGKTLLAMEATANFCKTFASGFVRYAEAEAAFDIDYAGSLGMPVERIQFNSEPLNTVEEWHDDLAGFIEKLNGQPGLYIIDSLDSLSDAAEMDRAIGDSSFGAGKAKKMSEIFRKLVRKIESSRCCVIVISQIRDNIGVMFGAKHSRSGGRALDFYASQILWLAEKGKLKRTSGGIERVVGLDIKAQCKKNKIGLPWRDCEFPILFGYGVDDITADAQWLSKLKMTDALEKAGITGRSLITAIDKVRNFNTPDQLIETRQILRTAVFEKWREIETGFLPPVRKY